MIVYTAYWRRSNGGACVLWERLVKRLSQSDEHGVVYAAPEVFSDLSSDPAQHELIRESKSIGWWLIRLFFIAWLKWKPPVGSIALSQGNLYSLALLPLRFKGAKLVTIVHGNFPLEYELNGHPRWLKRSVCWLTGIGYRKSDLLLPVSQDLQRGLIAEYGLSEERFQVVSNSVPKIVPLDSDARKTLRAQWSINGEDSLVLLVGSLTPIKRVDVLLEAVSLMPADRRPQVRVIGEGRLRQELEAQCQLLQIANHVKFLGAIPDIRSKMGIADLLVVCSDYEGCSTVLMEALANRVLVLGTRVGGIPEVIEMDELLIHPGDPETLATRLYELEQMPDSERAVLRERWLKRAEKFLIPWEEGVLTAMAGFSPQRSSGPSSNSSR